MFPKRFSADSSTHTPPPPDPLCPIHSRTLRMGGKARSKMAVAHVRRLSGQPRPRAHPAPSRPGLDDLFCPLGSSAPVPRIRGPGPGSNWRVDMWPMSDSLTNGRPPLYESMGVDASRLRQRGLAGPSRRIPIA